MSRKERSKAIRLPAPEQLAQLLRSSWDKSRVTLQSYSVAAVSLEPEHEDYGVYYCKWLRVAAMQEVCIETFVCLPDKELLKFYGIGVKALRWFRLNYSLARVRQIEEERAVDRQQIFENTGISLLPSSPIRPWMRLSQ